MGTIRIQLPDNMVDLLAKGQTITIKMEGPRRTAEPQPNSLPARILAWANTRGRVFDTQAVEKRFKVSRPHASMLLSRLASSAHPIRRIKRGVYIHAHHSTARAGRAR